MFKPFFFLTLFFIAPDAHPSEALIQRGRGTLIPELSFGSVEKIKVLNRKSKTNPKENELYVQLGASYSLADSALLVNEEPLNEEKFSSFKVSIAINKPQTPVRFTSITPDGRVRTETVTIDLPDYAKAKSEANAPGFFSKFKLKAGTGVSLVSYSQTGLLEISQIFALFKGELTFPLGPRWTIHGDGYANALKVSSNSSTVVAPAGGAARISYSYPIKNSRYSIVGNTGVYTTSTLFSEYGYQYVTGPLLFPEVVLQWSKTRSASAHIKYSPVFKGLGFYSLSSRELAAGLNYRFPLWNQNWEAGFEWASLRLDFDDQLLSASSLMLSISIFLL